MPKLKSHPSVRAAATVRRLLLLVGETTADPLTDRYDAVAGLGGASPRQGRRRFRLDLGDEPANFQKWGVLCVLLFPNAVRFDVCGPAPAAAAIYSELKALAEAGGGFETELLA